MKNTGKRAAVLISGGLDSCVLLYDLTKNFKEVFPLYIRNGLLWEKAELYWLRRFLKAIRPKRFPYTLSEKGNKLSTIHNIKILNLHMRDLYNSHWSLTGLDVPGYDTSDPSVCLPGRNLILLTKAVLYCAMNRIGVLALGPLKGNPFPDSSRIFFRAFERAASIGLGTRISILAPYLDRSKDEVIRAGKLLPLDLSFSCIQPVGEYHCGACNKCAERQRAFKKAGIADKTIYTGKGFRKPQKMLV